MDVPKNINILAATKGHSVEEIQKTIDSGISFLGENYVQEAKRKKSLLKGRFEYHFIGHLQKNKVKEALELFDVIQTIDSFELANEISKQAEKNFQILIEINSGEERKKSGVNADDAIDLIKKISSLPHVQTKGLMTMGPKENPRSAFQKTRKIFDRIKQMKLPNVHMDILSMGMSDSYQIAIEEGATMVRLGRMLFDKK